jgi:hypothetical protein
VENKAWARWNIKSLEVLQIAIKKSFNNHPPFTGPILLVFVFGVFLGAVIVPPLFFMRHWLFVFCRHGTWLHSHYFNLSTLIVLSHVLVLSTMDLYYQL